MQKSEQERDDDLAQMKDELQNRDNEIQKLMSERESSFCQNQQSEFEAETAILKSQIASLRSLLEQEKLSNCQTFEREKQTWLEQQRINEVTQTELARAKQILEAEVERLINETSGKDGQLSNLTAKIAELNSTVDRMRTTMASIESQAELTQSALHELQQQLQVFLSHATYVQSISTLLTRI